jgi:hypothetical protein
MRRNLYSREVFLVKKFVQQSLMMVAGLVGLPAAITHADQKATVPECRQDDPRFLTLRRFFHDAKCPVEHLSAAFISEADIHHLDWRLLPGLSMVESGGGRAYRGNNVFGWNNGNSSFRSVREGIHVVASKLAHSRFYRNKSVSDKLSTYNPNEGYSDSVKSMMRRISGTQALD